MKDLSYMRENVEAIRARLEAARLLTVRSAEHNGRLRKYYHITRAGLDRLDAFREDWREVMTVYQFVIREDSEDAEA